MKAVSPAGKNLWFELQLTADTFWCWPELSAKGSFALLSIDALDISQDTSINCCLRQILAHIEHLQFYNVKVGMWIAISNRSRIYMVPEKVWFHNLKIGFDTRLWLRMHGRRGFRDSLGLGGGVELQSDIFHLKWREGIFCGNTDAKLKIFTCELYP